MNKWKYFLTSILILSNTVYADPIVFIGKGQTAPNDGYLFPEAQALEMRKAILERDEYRLLNTSLNTTVKLQNDNINIQEQRIENYRKQNDEMAKALYSSQSMNNWERIGWFFLGIVGTGFAIYGIQKITK